MIFDNRKNVQTLSDLNSEINGYKRAIRKSQEEGENQNAVSAKLESEIEYIKRQIEDLSDQREKLSETYRVLLYNCRCMPKAWSKLIKRWRDFNMKKWRLQWK